MPENVHDPRPKPAEKEGAPQRSPFLILQEHAQRFGDQLVSAGRNELKVVEKTDDKPGTFFSGYRGYTQHLAQFFDVVDIENEPPTYRVLGKSIKELLEPTADSTTFPPNLVARIALRDLRPGAEEHQYGTKTSPRQTITFEYWGKVWNHSPILKFADNTRDGIPLIFPNDFEIVTSGRSNEDIEQRLTAAFKFLESFV